MNRLWRFLDGFLVLWALGSLVAVVMQFAFRRWIAGGTNWGTSPGWQREISFWNVGLILILLQLIARGHLDVKMAVVRSLVLLSLLFGTNHLVEVLRGGRIYAHVLWTVANYATVLLGGAVWLGFARRPDGS